MTEHIHLRPDDIEAGKKPPAEEPLREWLRSDEALMVALGADDDPLEETNLATVLDALADAVPAAVAQNTEEGA